MEMEYRRLGRSGLKVSVLSFGSWVTFGPQLDDQLAIDCLSAAYDAGINYFDNAESYAGGESERIMGQAIAKLGWPRRSIVVSTKIYWGLHDVPNMQNTLNRKYMLQAIDGSLERFGLDFVDLLFCHRADPDTPIEETVWAMDDIIRAGKALYWGTSEWAGGRDPGRVGDRRAPPPAQAGDGAAAVQPAAPPEGRTGIRPPLRGHRPGPDHLEPAGLGPALGQVSGRHSRRPAGPACPATNGCGTAHRSKANAKVRKLKAGGRRPGLHPGPAVDRLVRPQPAGVDRHHRRQPGGAGRRKPAAPSTSWTGSTTTSWLASSRPSSRRPTAGARSTGYGWVDRGMYRRRDALTVVDSIDP